MTRPFVCARRSDSFQPSQPLADCLGIIHATADFCDEQFERAKYSLRNPRHMPLERQHERHCPARSDAGRGGGVSIVPCWKTMCSCWSMASGFRLSRSAAMAKCCGWPMDSTAGTHTRSLMRMPLMRTCGTARAAMRCCIRCRPMQRMGCSAVLRIIAAPMRPGVAMGFGRSGGCRGRSGTAAVLRSLGHDLDREGTGGCEG